MSVWTGRRTARFCSNQDNSQSMDVAVAPRFSKVLLPDEKPHPSAMSVVAPSCFQYNSPVEGTSISLILVVITFPLINWLPRQVRHGLLVTTLLYWPVCVEIWLRPPVMRGAPG